MSSTLNTESSEIKFHESLLENIQSSIADFDQISEERKRTLEEIATYVRTKNKNGELAQLTFICTHNSRRSHMSQLWAKVAADYYGHTDVYTFSGGTESTAFNPRAVAAMERSGFEIEKSEDTSNPIYVVGYAENAAPMRAWSKTYFDLSNPQTEFAAVMTCSDADEACPIVQGAEARFSIPYVDPKISDGTEKEAETYDERCRQIATEMLYVFSKV